MATSKKRKTAVKKVAKVSQKRPKPAPPKKPIKSVRRSKPAPGSTRAGAAADSGPRYFWMFAFGADVGPVWWEVASGGTPRIGPPHHNTPEELQYEAPHSPPNNPGPTAILIADPPGLSPKVMDSELFFIMSQFFPTQEEAVAFIDTERGAFFRRRCANCVLYGID
jgi:hypothetical protein